MIFTVYLNPTIDKTEYFDEFQIGGTNRPVKSIVNGAGKAVNVSVVLASLGEENTCAGYLCADDSGIIMDRLKRHDVKCCFEEISGISRINTKIFDYSKHEITEINESGSPVGTEDMDRIKNKILALPSPGDTVIFTGSLPAGADDSIYADMISVLERRDVFCVLDASGYALSKGVEQQPDLIKPNYDEFHDLSGVWLDDLSAIPDILVNFALEKNIKYVALTLGGKGAFLTDSANVFYAEPMRVEILSTVGAGDSMVAGIVHGLKNGAEYALRCGVSAATASIMREGTQLMLKTDYDSIFDSVEVRKVL